MPVAEERAERIERRQEEETEKQRTQRQLVELLQELRVATTGVQVLFAFLLTIPFNPRFALVDQFQKTVYFVSLLLTALSSALLLAPTAYHRLRFHKRDREHIVEVSHRFALAGLAALALAMTGVVLLITDFLYDSKVLVVATTAATALLFLIFWLAMPLRRRLQADRAEPQRGG